MNLRLRDAAEADLPVLVRLVRALAGYEKLEHEARATEADFRRALFGTPVRAHALIAELDDEPVGFALWFHNFSTFEGRAGLYLEDIYVEPGHRGRGIGRAIFRDLARRAVAADCARLEWSVLDWNAPAVAFYRELGAAAMNEWTVQRLSGDALRALAA